MKMNFKDFLNEAKRGYDPMSASDRTKLEEIAKKVKGIKITKDTPQEFQVSGTELKIAEFDSLVNRAKINYDPV